MGAIMKEEEKNFIDFILEAQRNTQLVRDFLKVDTQKELKKFFDARGFRDIADTDYKKILTAKGNMPDTVIDLVKY